MADAGVGEAALLTAAAAAAAESAGTVALAALPEVLGTAAATAGTTAAAAAPVVAEALPAVVIPAALEAAPVVGATALEAAPVVGTAASTVAPVAAETLAAPTVAATVPTAAEAAASTTPVTTGLLGSAPEPVIIGATETEPVTTGLLGQGAAEYPLPGPNTFGSVSSVGPETTGVTATPSGVQVGTTAYGPPETELGVLADKAANWWTTSSLGDKLSVGGKALGGISSASKVLAPTQSGGGSKRTMTPGTTGHPQGGSQALAAVVENLLKRRDAFQNAGYGTAATYRPRSLLG